MLNEFLDHVPYPMVYIGYFLLFFLSVEAGRRLGRWAGLSADTLAESRKVQAGTVLGAILALVGFLLAFTFGMAGSQYGNRRQLVIDEANAIGTTFLRAVHLPEPHRSNSRRLLLEYVKHRHIKDKLTIAKSSAESEKLQQELWDEATIVTQEDRSAVVSIFIQSLNEMINLQAKQVSVTLWTRIPDMLFVTLAFLSVLALLLYGYWLGWADRRQVFPTALLVVAYAMVFCLVIDLDRPQGGFFQVSKQPMIELSERMHTTADLMKEDSSS
jgi:hypothetical protein